MDVIQQETCEIVLLFISIALVLFVFIMNKFTIRRAKKQVKILQDILNEVAQQCPMAVEKAVDNANKRLMKGD